MGYTPAGYADGGSYTFHFPDGNATIARLLVRKLIPGAVPGYDCRDVVTARIDYRQLAFILGFLPIWSCGTAWHVIA